MNRNTDTSLLLVRLVGLFLVLFASPLRGVEPVPDTIEVRPVEGAEKRNVVFILSDDHRYDAMSFMGILLPKRRTWTASPKTAYT